MANYLDKDGLDYYTKGLANKFAKTAAVPTKVSQLENDSNYLAESDVAALRTAVATNTSDITSLETTKADKSELPTKTSQLTNDSSFITNSVNNLTNYYDQTTINGMFNSLHVPTKVSELTNDSNFITNTSYASADTAGVVKVGAGLSITDGVLSSEVSSLNWDNIVGKPTGVSYWNNDAGYVTTAAIPTKTSQLTNDSGFITSAPTKTSDLTNDSGFITNSVSNLTNYYKKSETYTQSEVNGLLNTLDIPTKTSDLTNDSGFATASDIQTAVENKQDKLTAGDHIEITDSTIKAKDYVHSDSPVSAATTTQVVSNSMVVDKTLTFDKTATGEFLSLTLSKTDIGVGAALPANTLYGVYSD